MVQKPASRNFLTKRCSENMQQIYRRTPMPSVNSIKTAASDGMAKSSKLLDQCIWNVFISNLNLFSFEISRFSLYFSCAGMFITRSVKISLINLGLILLRVLHISMHKVLQLQTLILVFPDIFNNSFYKLL